MAIKFENISVRDLARGLDQNSAPSNVDDGYAEDLVNVDTNAQGHLSKRVGYQGYDGVLPIRVKSAAQSGTTKISLTLPDGIDTSDMAGLPVVIYGHLSSQPTNASDWSTTDSAHYYTTTTTELPVVATAPSGTVTIASAQSGAASSNLFVTALQSTSTVDTSSSLFFPDQVAVENASDWDVSLDYTIAANTNLYIAVTDKSTVAGQSYVATDTVTAASTEVLSIPTATHALDSFSILAQCWYHDVAASEWVYFIPDRVAYNATTGDVSVDVTNSAATNLDVKVVLASAPVANSNSATIAGGATGTIVCTATDIEYYHMTAYQFTGTDWEMVIPDSVVFDAVAETITVTITNSSAASATYQVHWEETTITSNVLNVIDTGAGTPTWSDATPQLTIWGLPHAGSYTGGDTPGHVTHLDTYRRESEERVVAGLGGIMHSARTRAEAGTDYLMPSSAVTLQGRLSSTQVLGPAFIATGGSTDRTRGTIAADDVVANKALVTGVTVSSSGVAVYQLSLTNKVGSLATALDSAGTDADWLTVTGMANSVNNGTFLITAVDNTANTITVANALATISEFTETGARGRAAVYTDKLTTDTSDFIPSDTLLADGVSLTVLRAGSTTVVVSNATANVTLPIGLVLYGRRTSYVVPVASTANYVVGDMTTIADLNREIRVLGVYPRADVTISSVTGTGTTATATTAAAHNLLTGQKVLLYKQAAEGNPYIGVQTVTDTPTATTFTFASTATTTLTSGMAIKGYTVELDESVTYADDASDPDELTVTGRWIPFEAPTSDDSLPATTHYRYLDVADYDSQPTVRSTMVTDSLFLTNASDEVYKIDGSHNYQAGLPRWQPQLFVTVDTATGSIPVRTTSATTAGAWWTQNKFIIGRGQAVGFSVGQLVSNPEDSAIYTITAKGDDGTNDFLYVDRNITGTQSVETLTEVSRYAYYFRLNAIDANQNVIASAATGAQDFLVDLPSTGQIHLRLVGLPAFGNYDYDSLEVQVYRTKASAGGSGPFYLIRTVDMAFNDGDGYIDIFDGTPDSDLTTVLFDEVNSALLGPELGTGWAPPPRASHITSVDNRLLLANTRDYPELDITVRKKANSVSVSGSDLSGKLWLFRKAHTDTSTTTNMVDRARYEFRTSGAVTIAPTADPATSDITTSFVFVDADVSVVDNQITEADHNMATGDRITLSTTGVLPGGLSAATSYYVIRVSSSVFKLATTAALATAGTAIDITSAAGGGNHTVTMYDRFRIAETAHGLVSGNWIYLFHAAAGTNNRLRYAGWWQVDVAATNSFSVRYAGDGTATSANDVDRYVAASAGVDIPIWIGTDGNRAQVGANDISERTAMLRLAEGINASMRQAVVTSGFAPWLVAAAGSEIGLGRMLVRQESVFDTTMEMVVPAAITSADVYVQGIARTAADQVSASTRLFPSRLVVSYPNYPEIFDNPAGTADNSDSVIDINTADGQEITGIIPFFGESVFGTGAAESVVVAFKTNSIYLVDINSKRINKLNTRGLGCTAPHSIAATKDGIMFANESGIYRLNRDQSISYVGEMLERLWEDSVNKDSLAVAVGHHYGVGRKYKLSVPVGDDQETNNHVYVYDHQREGKDQEFGAWTRYTNHAATGWCNLAANAYFSTTDGQVFKIRNAGDSTDYRDDAAAVATMEITLKAMDFGAAGIRKIISHVTSHFHMRRSDMDGTALSIAPDLTGAFVSAGAFTVTRNANLKVINATSSVPNRKLEFIQLKYTNSTKDEDVILTGVDFRVAGLDRHGIPQSDDIS